VLYRRSLVQIAKGNSEAAAVYLNKLAGMPFYRAEAKRLLGMFNDSGALLSEPRVAAMRKNMDTADYFLFTENYDTMFKNLLQSNPGNKAVFDYLMTYYLLIGRLEGAAVLAPKAREFGYSLLPRCWEEALCVFQAANAPQTFSGTYFRPETVGRFNEFARACMAQRNDSTAAVNLTPAYGRSYFFYSIFRYTPGVRHE
jgi:hypothetical protein